MLHSNYPILYAGNTFNFELYLLRQAEQELRVGKPRVWTKIADIYAKQLTIISINPYPEAETTITIFGSDEIPPSLKHIIYNTNYHNFYRWGIKGERTGNHRIIYAIHNYHKVILLHYFDKQYNGLIKQKNILPAEENYAIYCKNDPTLY